MAKLDELNKQVMDEGFASAVGRQWANKIAVHYRQVSYIESKRARQQLDEVHGTEGRVREGEENLRCPAHSAGRLAVASNLGPHERRTNPDAIQACTKEWIMLRENFCWDDYDVGQSAIRDGPPRTKGEKPREWVDVARDYRRIKKKVHFRYLDELCMLKGSELEEGSPLRRHKRRVVFRGNQVWTATLEKAVFEEANCNPADMLAAKTADAWSCMRGHVCQQADANQAYTQAPFVGDTDPYVRLPEDRWPKLWKHEYPDLVDPVCRLHKASCGHPDAEVFGSDTATISWLCVAFGSLTKVGSHVIGMTNYRYTWLSTWTTFLHAETQKTIK